MRPKPQLFSRSELQAPGVLKSELEWEQQDQERRLTEMQRYEAGHRFTYEPYHYPWCDALTPFDATLPEEMETALMKGGVEAAREFASKSTAKGKKLLADAKGGDGAALQELANTGSASMNPVTGEISEVYALCARMNPAGQCPLFEEP